VTPADILREYTRTVEIATRSEVVEVERLDTDAMAAEIVRLRAKVGRVWKVTRKQSMSAAESCNWGDPYATRVVSVAILRAALEDTP
jgi:hypothetical protein